MDEKQFRRIDVNFKREFLFFNDSNQRKLSDGVAKELLEPAWPEILIPNGLAWTRTALFAGDFVV
jgi:hypothetical protein